MPVEYDSKAIKDLKGIEVTIRKRIITKIEQYAEAPESLANNVTQLVGSPFNRLRVGDYRVIFTLGGEVAVVMTVKRVSHRREAYD